MMALTTYHESVIHRIPMDHTERTILEIGGPCLSLVPGASNVVDTPLYAPVCPRWYRECMLYDSHRFQPGFEDVR